RPRRTVTILKVVSAVLSLAFWIAFCLLWYHYAVTRPSQPDAAVGRIYAERQIEQAFYLTTTERSIWYLLTGAGVSCFLLGVGLPYSLRFSKSEIPRNSIQVIHMVLSQTCHKQKVRTKCGFPPFPKSGKGGAASVGAAS